MVRAEYFKDLLTERKEKLEATDRIDIEGPTFEEDRDPPQCKNNGKI